MLYTEVLNQSQRLLSEGVNVTHKLLRLRARPKILLCTTYEQAWGYYEKYQEFILGIISDINFLHNGVKDPEGGLHFSAEVRARHTDIPILLQSSNPEFEARAREIGASFLLKSSPRLMHDLRHFTLTNLGFGDFVFRTLDGREVGRASNLKELEEQLHVVPEESIVFHGERNHFSNWLKARTEFWLAHRLRPRKVSEFTRVSDLREELIRSLHLYQEIRRRGVITEFSPESFDPNNSFARIGSGSLGERRAAWASSTSSSTTTTSSERFDGVDISVPSGVVLATDVFDRFMDENGLDAADFEQAPDEEIIRRFREAPHFPADVLEKLAAYLGLVRVPLAVRSSSLLEDSQYQPFAGVYQTYMIANNNPDERLRLLEVLQSIRLIYASTFLRRAKDYMKATSYQLEEEKMAVIVQQMVGARRNNRFYPDFSGVAKSYNFYPVPPQKSTDGIALVALGLGKMVVDGGNSVRFCPKYPRHLMQFFSTKETIKNAQQEFYALDLASSLEYDGTQTPDLYVRLFDLRAAEDDRTLFAVGSTYSPENDAVYDGVSRSGKRVVTFAPVLKHHIFPLPEILDLILEMGTWGMGTPVEIEFAVDLEPPAGRRKEFSLLQMRPLVLSYEMEELHIDAVDRADLICESQQVLGNGVIDGLRDVVMVDIHTFERNRSRDVAQEVAALNTRLMAERRPYVLIGVGRWGSLDQWLGIPVTWDQIGGAAVIVESAFKDLNVTPSQGSHFFQNITSFRVGYFTVNTFMNQGFIDWEWLREQPPESATQFVRHLAFARPLTAKINGHKNQGIILKPGR